MAEKTKFNRRDFLKVVGAGAGIAASGCGKNLPEKFIPYVVQPDDVIPGVAAWYAGSCSECSAGCGTLIRTREGRAVKIEGNPLHPVNTGGLCSYGQSALQVLYDPDRIREPMRRDVSGPFGPVSWKDGVDAMATAMADAASANKEVLLLTGPVSGSELLLIQEFSRKFPALKHVEYQLNNSDAVDLAAEQVFGKNLRTKFNFAKADVIVGFGADYLESWISPCEFSRDWAAARRAEGKDPAKVFHFEPRLSLTAANADHWVMNAPGTETAIMLALLTLIAGRGRARLTPQAQAAVGGRNVAQLLEGTNVSPSMLEALAEQLVSAKSSLVVAGGAAVSGSHAVTAAVLANHINSALGNLGITVELQRSARSAVASHQALNELLGAIAAKQRQVGVLIVSGVNPAYSLSSKSKWKEAIAAIGTVVAVSTQMDETTEFANLVLPLSHQLERWGDSEPQPGLYNLNQPAMAPLYKTQSLGDTLIAVAANGKLPNAKFGELGSFYDYLREKWKERTGESNFESRWVEYVEKGGDWSKRQANEAAGAYAANGSAAALTIETPKPVADSYTLLVFPTVNNFDGRGASRPWLQEIPDPISTTVWGTWIEIHPDTAAKLGVATGDVVQVITEYGAVESPAYVSKYVHPQVVAVPLGQGHTGLGRYAAGVGANALAVLSPESKNGSIELLAGGVKLRRSVSKETLVKLQGSDSQKGRGIARNVSLGGFRKLEEKFSHAHGDHGHGEGHGEGHGGGHHVDLLALGPREPQKHMYHQMKHEELPHRWAMTVDLQSCTGCSACIVACYAENNISVVGKTICDEGREMSWIHMERYLDGPAHRPVVAFVPMFCQHCANAPCEPVCPVYATYHTEDGLNSMVYNRCVGTRYCLNNCSYKVRRFNWYKYSWPEPVNWQLNPDVTVREVGVMEKCTFCVQRIREGVNRSKDEGRAVRDGDVVPACSSSCPTGAIKFGNLNDQTSQVAHLSRSARGYKVLDAELNTQPAVTYLARVNNE